MNYTNNTMPERFRGLSPMMVNTLLRYGYSDEATIRLLSIADETGNHPDWSEATDDDIREHFSLLAEDAR